MRLLVLPDSLALPETSSPTSPAKHRRRSLVIVAATAVLALSLDQLSKAWVVRELIPERSVAVIGEALQFMFVRNPGAAFSLASGATWIFSIAAAAVVVCIVVLAGKLRSKSWAAVFGMLLGGTLGNLSDRLFREPAFGVGHVVDFIKVYGFPAIFNVADMFIVVSMALFAFLTLRGIRFDGTRSEVSRSREALDGN